MNPHSGVPTRVFALALFFALAQTASPQDEKTATIKGRVLELETSKPIVGIPIVMGGLNVSTDSNGHFEFTNIPAGLYRDGLTLARQRGYFKPLQAGGPD